MKCKYCEKEFSLSHIQFRHEQFHCKLRKHETEAEVDVDVDEMEGWRRLRDEGIGKCSETELKHLHGLMIWRKNRRPFMRFKCSECGECYLWERELRAHKC